MESVFDKEMQPVQKKRGNVRSKSDRLGWTPFNEVAHKPLKEVMGKIRILTDEKWNPYLWRTEQQVRVLHVR